jgi:hypothetical protein
MRLIEETDMPAGLVQTYRAFAYNNARANHRLLTACADLSQKEFESERTGFFPSCARRWLARAGGVAERRALSIRFRAEACASRGGQALDCGLQCADA